MPETPNSTLLDRGHSAAVVKQHHAAHLQTLEELVNYGSNLLLRAYHSSAKDLSSLICCTVLLKQVVAMLDGAHLALVAGTTKPAALSVRAAFEASLYLQWILASDGPRKAATFYVGNLRNTRHWARMAAHGVSPGDGIPSEVADTISDLAPEHQVAAQTQLSDIDRILNTPEFRAVNNAFEKARKAMGKRGHEPDWYKVADPAISSVKKLAEAIGRAPEYLIIYGRTSEVMHASAYRDHIRIAHRKASIKPIRDGMGTRELIFGAMLVAIATYEHVLKFYRPQEVVRWKSQYTEEWRAAFLEVSSMMDPITFPDVPR